MLKEIDAEKYGFKFSFDDGDKFVGCNVAYGVYEPYESELLLSKVKKDSVIFDVGANVGYFSLLCAKRLNDFGRFARKGKVFAFEPNLKNYLLLERNVGINSFRNVQPLNYAVGDEDREMELFLSIENQGDHQLYSSENRVSEKVQMRSLDSIIEEHAASPDIIKIDTQGFDLFVLKGLEGYIKSCDSLKVFTEFWDHGNKNAGVDSRENFEFLTRYFSKVLCINEEDRKLEEIDFDEVMERSRMHEGMAHLNFYCEK